MFALDRYFDTEVAQGKISREGKYKVHDRIDDALISFGINAATDIVRYLTGRSYIVDTQSQYDFEEMLSKMAFSDKIMWVMDDDCDLVPIGAGQRPLG
jgi:hypothetical protein